MDDEGACQWHYNTALNKAVLAGVLVNMQGGKDACQCRPTGVWSNNGMRWQSVLQPASTTSNEFG